MFCNDHMAKTSEFITISPRRNVPSVIQIPKNVEVYWGWVNPHDQYNPLAVITIPQNDRHIPIELLIFNLGDPDSLDQTSSVHSLKTYQGGMSDVKSFENGTITNASSCDTDSRSNHTADRAPYTVTYHSDQAQFMLHKPMVLNTRTSESVPVYLA